MNTLRSLYWESTRSTRFLTIIVCMFGATGVWLRSKSPNGDMSLVMHLAPWWCWTAGLLLVAAHRYWCLWRSAICDHDCLETKPGILMCILALFIWSTFLASSAADSHFGLALMLLVCDVIEAWLLSRHIQQVLARKGVKCE